MLYMSTYGTCINKGERQEEIGTGSGRGTSHVRLGELPVNLVAACWGSTRLVHALLGACRAGTRLVSNTTGEIPVAGVQS
jgi:hypothetical protein